MSNDSKITWRLQHVLVKIAESNKAALGAVALQIAGEAKVKIQANRQIDTGFMLNSVYAVTNTSDGYGQAKSEAETHDYSAKEKRRVDVGKRMAPPRALGAGDTALVVVGANYAAEQEARQSFLYAAAEKVGKEVGAIVEPIYKAQNHD